MEGVSILREQREVIATQAADAERAAAVAMLQRKAERLRFKGRRLEAATLEEQIYNIATRAHLENSRD
jgi:hypothetical protein